MARRIEVVEHNPAWAQDFAEEAERICLAMGDNVAGLYHIGSTAIPGIKAKPTIDILGEVKNLEAVDACNLAMKQKGYEPRGENGIPGRRYFVRKRGETHAVHVHIFVSGHPEVKRHLDFRDYLRAHPGEAKAYSRLKEELASAHPEDSLKYTDGKTAFVAEIDCKAKEWRSRQPASPQNNVDRPTRNKRVL